MKINMPAVTEKTGSTADSVQYETALLEKAKSTSVSSFKLRLSRDPDVQRYELGVLLRAARDNPRYQSHAANYQFKLKSDSQGQYLTLKQQGWWSSFKGMVGWGRQVREQQRTDAMDLINSRLRFHVAPTDADENPILLGPKDRLNFVNAKSYQVNVFAATSSSRGVESTKKELKTFDDLFEEEKLPGSSAFIKSDEAPASANSWSPVPDNLEVHNPPQETHFGQPFKRGAPVGESGDKRDPSLDINEFLHQRVGLPPSPPQKRDDGSILSGSIKGLQRFYNDSLVQRLFDSPIGLGNDNLHISNRSYEADWPS